MGTIRPQMLPAFNQAITKPIRIHGVSMSLKAKWFRDKLRKKGKQGFQGYPMATVAYYGPDNQHASKAVAAVFQTEGSEPAHLERWFSDQQDARNDPAINEAIVRFVQLYGAKSVVMPDGILGCPHEEGIDYPEGQSCPQCPYWAGRDRFTGERQH